MKKKSARITFNDDFNEPCYRVGDTVYKNDVSRRLAAYEDTGLEPEEIVQLIDKRKGLEQVKMFECVEEIGPYERPKVVLFNKSKISYDEALYCVRAGEYNPNVICLERDQFYAVFRREEP